MCIRDRISPLRLCLAPPSEVQPVCLWQGGRLKVFTLPPADLVASRLIRYDPIDQADIQFLMLHHALHFEDIAKAVGRLPPNFRSDVLVQDNLANLRRDAARWMP